MQGGLEGRDLDSTAFLDLTDRENLKYVFHPYLWKIIYELANLHFPAVSAIYTEST
jgi:hypothetical protein